MRGQTNWNGSANVGCLRTSHTPAGSLDVLPRISVWWTQTLAGACPKPAPGAAPSGTRPSWAAQCSSTVNMPSGCDAVSNSTVDAPTRQAAQSRMRPAAARPFTAQHGGNCDRRSAVNPQLASRAAPGRALAAITVAGLVLVLSAGCASRQPVRDGAMGSERRDRSGSRDGPDANPPAGLMQRPDAQPRVEPLRVGGPNKPYEVFGQRYVPITADQPLAQAGLASWYGRKFHGLPTSSGEPYDMYAMTAAHATMPIPSYARVRNPANGREIIVRVNDRGPFSPGRVIDLSYTAALKLGVLSGVAPVEVVRLTHDDIRAGTWSRATLVAAAAPVATVQQVQQVQAVPVPVAAAPGIAPIAVPIVVAVPAPASEPALAPAPAPAPAPVTSPPVSAPVLASIPAALPIDDVAPGDMPPPATGVWLQLGAFRSRDGAQTLQQRALRQVDGLPAVAVFDEGGLFRVQAGPFASRADVLDAINRLRLALGGLPVIVERR